MTYAVKKNDFIVNMIVARPSQVEELETALSAELIDPKEYGLTIGDYWNGTNWTRNVDGEQVVLEPVELTPTVDERVASLEVSTAALEDALCDIDAALCKMGN
jgi:hypothetical protein